MEIARSGIENQNAIRQPQLLKFAAGMLKRVNPITIRAIIMPTVAVVWIQLVA